ncbi:MAG TPA: alpha/beta hydrolase-fold protein [Rhizomicrobium sp.]|jgi:S-formylglutathione hydrolase FrmB|nr:alpha/beta hydrolase-fold protein [Rhizomicrobium sp.]
MRRNATAPAGEVHRLTVDSDVLEGNLLRDPATRIVDVYVPAGRKADGLPLLVDLVGFTAGGPAHTNWRNFTENVPERLDRLIFSGAMPPAVVAFPDCFTKLGGNQYINSAGVGRWADFLLDEAVPFVERKFHCGGNGRRGVFGKSSGGYGAMAHALLYPDFWSAAACHSGDMAFELCYLPEFPRLLRALAKAGGSIEKWITDFYAASKIKDSDVHDLMTLAMCATYDPDPRAPFSVRLPVDPYTCELNPERWAKWTAWDPLVMAETRGPGLAKLKALYIDCGDVDQYNLVYGARRMHRLLERLGVTHLYEEFPDDHSSVDYRMDKSLPYLAKALS